MYAKFLTKFGFVTNLGPTKQQTQIWNTRKVSVGMLEKKYLANQSFEVLSFQSLALTNNAPSQIVCKNLSVP